MGEETLRRSSGSADSRNGTKKAGAQPLLATALIASAALFFVHALGFMTDFFILFMDGDDALYSFYKDLQTMNNLLFTAAATLLPLTLFLIAFELHRGKSGIFGLAYLFGINIAAIYFCVRILIFTGFFHGIYRQLDFSPLKNYAPSSLPFVLTYLTYGAVVLFSAALLAAAALNFIRKRRTQRNRP